MIEDIKAYKLSDLEKKEKLNRLTIKKRELEYIPIAFENAQASTRFRRGIQKSPYSIRYIRLKDIEKYLKDRK